MIIYPTNSLFLLSAIFLFVFSKNRYDAHKQDPSNRIIYRYYLASLYIALALLCYGLPAFYTQDHFTLSLFVILAMVLNAVGFNHFLIITLYSWLSPRAYVIVKYTLFLFIAVMAICAIIDLPQPFIDVHNIFHFRFSSLVGWMAALHMDIIFAANIILIALHFYRLKQLSVMNSLALVLTFIIAGLSGSYSYVGDSPMGLYLAAIGLYLGIATIFYTIIHGTLNRMLSWQTRKV